MAQGRELPVRCSWGLRPPPSANRLCPVSYQERIAHR